MVNEQANTGFLRNAFVMDGQGGGAALAWDELKALNKTQDWQWVDFNLASDHTHEWIEAQKTIPAMARAALVDDDSRPGTFEFDNGILIILRGVNLNNGEQVDDMISIRMWLETGRVITCRRRTLQSVRTIAADIQSGDGPRTPGGLISSLIEELSVRIVTVDNELIRTLANIDSKIENNENPEPQLGTLRRSTARLKRYLSPQKEALQRLQNHKGSLISPAERQNIQLAADRIILCLEEIDLIREGIMSHQDEWVNRQVMEQNSRMYILSIVAAIFLPLTFFTGLLGMNVGGIPGSASPYGFLVIVGLSAIITTVLLIYFRNSRWL